MKTLTKSQIQKRAQKLTNAARKLYKKIDNLMDESEISCKGCTKQEITRGKHVDFDTMANKLSRARVISLDVVEILKTV